MNCRGPGFLAVEWFGSSPTPPPPPSASCLSFSVFPCVASRAYWRESGGCARSQIIRPRESLALYKSFNTKYSLPLIHSQLSSATLHFSRYCYLFFVWTLTLKDGRQDVCLSDYQSVCLSDCLSVCLSDYLSVCLTHWSLSPLLHSTGAIQAVLPGYMAGGPVRQPCAGVDFISQSGIYEFGYS